MSIEEKDELEIKKEILQDRSVKRPTIKRVVTDFDVKEQEKKVVSRRSIDEENGLKDASDRVLEYLDIKEERSTPKELSKKEIMEKFATQRVDSIRDELSKSSARKMENEELDRKEKAASELNKNKNMAAELYRVIDSNEEVENEEDDDDVFESDYKQASEEIGRRARRLQEKPKKKKKKFIFRFLRFILILGIIGIACLAFLLYGPWSGFRDWYIGCAMTTMNHQWLATMFFSDETINDYLEKNKVKEVEGVTDNSLITKKTDDELEEQLKYANEYERQILEKDPNHPDYKLIDIEGKGYNGYLAVVYDASKIHTMVTSKLDVVGEYVTTMAQREGAVLAINGGGFDDPNYSSNGGSPTGITYSRGELITNRGNTGGFGGLIGFTNDDVLTVGRMSAEEANRIGMRDAVTCGPLLIINGESSEILGNGGWGDAARTVIGQRQDGIVLMLVLNGRNYVTGIIGADMDDLIEIMERYGAYNAACLDGGTSSVIVENGEILNDPIDGRGRHQTRFIPTAFGVFLDEDEQ